MLVDDERTTERIKFFPAGGRGDPTKVYATTSIVKSINDIMEDDRFKKQIAGFLINYFISSTRGGSSCWNFDRKKFTGKFWKQYDNEYVFRTMLQSLKPNFVFLSESFAPLQMKNKLCALH